MIIVEGTDGAGKSTLVNALAKDLGLYKSVGVTGQEEPGWPKLKDRRFRDRELPRFPRERTYEAIANAVTGSVLIHDRLFWSEVVYGDILRGKVQFTPLEQFRIMNILKAMRVPVIFCHVPFEATRADLDENPPQLEGWTLEKAHEIWVRYSEGMELAHGKKLNVIGHDYTGMFPQSLFKTQFVDYGGVLSTCESYLEDRREWTV